VKNVILDLCGGSGSWSKPYKDAGFDVRVITLPKYDVTKTRFSNDYIWLGSGGPNIYCLVDIFRYADIYGILVAPPCTEFSVAKHAELKHNTKPRDFAAGMEIVEACLQIIWQVQIHAKLEFWALENPRGYLRRFLGIPKYTFYQWQFGAQTVKATDIWGYFNLPTPTVKTKPVLDMHDHRNTKHYSSGAYPPEYRDYIYSLPSNQRRAAGRAITPAGFAKAFYRANSRRTA